MTTENELLEIAKEVLTKNEDLNAKLSGILMLAVMGLNKRRQATDIDIICDYLRENSSADGYPWVPKGFEFNNMDGNRSQVEAIQFINEDGIKIEFMASDEMGEVIDCIPCAELVMLVRAKLNYAKNDNSEESRAKHLEDLVFLFEKNKKLQIF